MERVRVSLSQFVSRPRNREAAYPLFNCGGVTYFPMTFDYTRAFGWACQWDAENAIWGSRAVRSRSR